MTKHFNKFPMSICSLRRHSDLIRESVYISTNISHHILARKVAFHHCHQLTKELHPPFLELTYHYYSINLCYVSLVYESLFQNISGFLGFDGKLSGDEKRYCDCIVVVCCHFCQSPAVSLNNGLAHTHHLCFRM